MTGPKTNEGATKVGEQVGTRAVARNIRSSAYKAREVLDQIRGLDVKSADEILEFIERDIAIVIRKVLASAVANAQNNDGLDPDELFVTACYSDEGPTMKRMRPRARGRAGAIRKRTCHIIVLVAPMQGDLLAKYQLKAAARPSTSGAGVKKTVSRRDRVAKSRAKSDDTHDHSDHDHDHGDTSSDEKSLLIDAAPYGDGSAAPLEDGSAPDGFDIKGNAQSMLYHVPGGRYYAATKAEVWFSTAEAAEVAGFQAQGTKNDKAEEAE
jgi:large subunit ribosomal protein L22